MNTVLAILVYAAGTIVICGALAGTLSFSTRRASKVKKHENATIATQSDKPNPRREPNRIIIYQRLDRHEYYIGILIALWFAGVGVMLVPIGTGTLATLASSTQELLAFAMILGSSLSLLGASLGPPRTAVSQFNPMRWWFPHFKESVAYGIGAGGQFAIGVALGFFGWTVLTNGTLVGGVTGLITPVLSICSFRLGRRLWREHNRLDAQWHALRQAAEGSA